MIAEIAKEAAALSWVDWVATSTALVYVVLAARNQVWCWFWGIVSCSLWAYASYAFYGLYLDALLQLFYVGMSFVGIYNWKYGGQEGADAPVRQLSPSDHFTYLIAGSLLALAFGYFFDNYTPAAATYWDAFTTVFSVLATFMLVRRLLDNWAYWVVIDLVYVGLYYSRGAYLFALLMVIYTIIAALAWREWRKQRKVTLSR